MKEKIRNSKYYDKYTKLKKTGFFSIFASSIFGKIITFFSGIFLIRIMTKSDYGLYSYVLNAISMLTLLNDFGASNSALQYLTENDNDIQYKKQILNWTIKVGTISILISGILILLSPLYYPFTLERANKLVPILFLMPVFNFVNSLIPVILRSRLDNKKYARLQLITIIINYAVLLPMAFFFSILGAVLSQYIYSLIIFIYGIYLIKDFLKSIKTVKIEKKDDLKSEEKNFWKFALTTQLSNTIGGFLLVIDTFLIGLLIANSELIATYKVATIIPHALAFIPSCVVIYILPYFIKNNNNPEWLMEKYKKTIKYGIIGYGILTLILLFGSELIFYILYGNKYDSAIPIYIVLIIGFFFTSAFKIPSANITYGLRKVNVNLTINIICIIVNFISNIIFIKWLGIIGAAITTTIINILSSIIYIIYVYNILKRGVYNGDNKKSL